MWTVSMVSEMPDAPFDDAQDSPVLSTDGTRPDRQPVGFWRGIGVAVLVLVALDWLLGSLLWLPFFSGLIGFLVEGLIAGGIGFRVARSARPVSRRDLWTGILFAVVISSAALLWFEFFHFSARIGRPPNFAKARNQALRDSEGDDARRAASKAIGAESIAAFHAFLESSYSPGGAIGYARWVTTSGETTLTVRGDEEKIVAEHRGWIWPIRSFVGALMLVLGLGLAFDALKSPTPVRNVLAPGEAYEEID
jgi:hypothetical protein